MTDAGSLSSSLVNDVDFVVPPTGAWMTRNIQRGLGYVAFASGSCGWTGVGGGAISLRFVAGTYRYFERSSRAVDVHGGAVSAADAVAASSMTETIIHVDTFSRGSKSGWDIFCRLFFIF